MDVFVPKLSVLLERDPYLKNHEEELRKRYGEFTSLMYRMDQEGGIKQFSLGYKSFGAQVRVPYLLDSFWPLSSLLEQLDAEMEMTMEDVPLGPGTLGLTPVLGPSYSA